jgi:hypothetical protein
MKLLMLEEQAQQKIKGWPGSFRFQLFFCIALSHSGSPSTYIELLD